MRSSLDGTGSRIIVYGYYPRNLVIDYMSQTLYWIEEESILASNTDGSNVRVVASDVSLYNPDELAFFRNTLYWVSYSGSLIATDLTDSFSGSGSGIGSGSGSGSGGNAIQLLRNDLMYPTSLQVAALEQQPEGQ